MNDRKLGIFVRRPMWWTLFELGIRRQTEYEWDEASHIHWSLMLGFVGIDFRHRVRASSSTGDNQ